MSLVTVVFQMFLHFIFHANSTLSTYCAHIPYFYISLSLSPFLLPHSPLPALSCFVAGKRFTTSANSKGYKILPPYIRVIQGDGVSYESLKDILENVKKNGWSTDNLVFGSGGNQPCEQFGG